MASSSRYISVTFSDGVSGTNRVSAADNAASPASITYHSLSSGANTITVPSATTTGMTIEPPAGNTITMTLKGITGDTGFRLHLTDPSSLGIDPVATPTFVITTSDVLPGLRIIWS